MKPCFIFLLCFCTGYSLSAQERTTLMGHIDHPKGNKVYLKHYSEYLTFAEVTIDSGVISKKGDFKMTFNWSKPGPTTFYHGDEITELYLCPGDELHLYLDTRQFDETLVYKGIGADRNKYCAQKMLESSLTDPSIYKMPANIFASYVDSIRDVKTNRLESYTSTSGLMNQCLTDFLNFERTEIEYEWAYEKVEYPAMYRYYNQGKGDIPTPPADVEFLNHIKIDNPEAMQSTWYVSFLEVYIAHEVNKLLMDADAGDEFGLKEKFITEHFKGPVLDYAYANLIHQQLTYFNDTLTACPALRRYKATLPDGAYATILDNAVATINRFGPGNLAPDFTATDAAGKTYSLHDFRGQLVYLDIWATWCGPCVAEIPAMEKLIDLFEGEDVAFVSVSVDDDHARWKKFIVDKKMRGVQLHSPGGFEASIAKQYAVVGIPRYILIDKDGIIIEGNADRPGSMRDQLNSLLD